MANRFPLVFDAAVDNKIKELPSGDNLNLLGSSIVDVVNINASGTITANALNVNTVNITGAGNLANVALSNNYYDLDNLPALFSGDYNDLTNKPSVISNDWADITNKPTIPTKTSQLLNDTGFITNSNIVVTTAQVIGLSDVGASGEWNDILNRPTNVSNFINDAGYVTAEDIAGGTLTVEVNNTGNLVGSVFGDDSSLLLDHLNGKFKGDLEKDNLVVDANSSLVINSNSILIGDSGITDYVMLGENYALTVTNSLNLTSNGSTAITSQSGLTLSSGGDVTIQATNVVLTGGAKLNGDIEGDVTGSLFGDDSTLIIDGLNNNVYATTLFGNLRGNVTQTGVTLGITGDSGIQISPNGAFNLSTATDVTLANTGTFSINSTSNVRLNSASGKIKINGAIPTTARGEVGDEAGMIALDNNYIYFCIADYVDGNSAIWVRQGWSDTSDWS